MNHGHLLAWADTTVKRDTFRVRAYAFSYFVFSREWEDRLCAFVRGAVLGSFQKIIKPASTPNIVFLHALVRKINRFF